MAPTFQKTLLFTIIGLSFAAPNARQVRWCVISDLEQKKCNDLVGSCNVPDITLVCVHKSSTEDCMTAIKDGQADAMFLDSGDVYKASMDLYNLKPIIAEPHSSQRDLPKCLKERQEALGEDEKVIGRFVPDCDEKGDYQPQQCHGSTGYCWCVNAIGEEIAGTKTPPGQTPATCEKHDWDTRHYAVAVVKKSSSFQFIQLKGKRSCHSCVSKAAGWKAPVNVLVEKKFLSWDDSAKESIEQAVSKFFSASCIPGATETNLCEQCMGEEGRRSVRAAMMSHTMATMEHSDV
ncbi:unnamed protein product [Staurois parvus]|uniref:Thyroglobulin type-1 domain-containing protein n=1 Tax=Staurois parvus TaxID=386267 RepID=A0ABN9FNA5_9NEOB|nr:unnamed protein product [Staurois parvus]